VPSIEPSASAVLQGAQTTPGGASIGIENADARTKPRLAAPAGAAPEVDPHSLPPNRVTRRRYHWAELLQRVFEIDALRCPRCDSTLRLIAAIEDPAVARRILECLKLPARAPPVEPASWAAIPPKPVAPGRDAGWEFDQSRPTRDNSEPMKTPTDSSGSTSRNKAIYPSTPKRTSTRLPCDSTSALGRHCSIFPQRRNFAKVLR